MKLNRAVVTCQIKGPQQAIEELKEIKDLDDYYLYHSIIAEFYSMTGANGKSLEHFQKAYDLTDSHAEKELLVKKMDKLNRN